MEVQQHQQDNKLTANLDQEKSSPISEEDSSFIGKDRICYDRESLLQLRGENSDDTPVSLVLLSRDADCLVENYVRKETFDDAFDFTPSYLKSEKSLAREKEGLLLGPQSRSFSHSFQSTAVPAENRDRDNVRIQPSRGKPNRTFRRSKRPSDYGNENFNGQRYDSYRNQEQNDAPEWMTFGPSSRMETIELHGFDKQKEKVSESNKPVSNNDQVEKTASEKKGDEDTKDNGMQQLDFDLDRFLTMEEPDLIPAQETSSSNEGGSSRFSKLFSSSTVAKKDELDIVMPESLASIIASPDGSPRTPRNRLNANLNTSSIEQQQQNLGSNKGSAFDKLVATMRAAGRLPANPDKNASNLGPAIAPTQHPQTTINEVDIKGQSNTNVVRKLNFNQDMRQSAEFNAATVESAPDVVVSPVISGIRQPTGRVIVPNSPANVENYAMRRDMSNDTIVGPLPESRAFMPSNPHTRMQPDIRMNTHDKSTTPMPESGIKKSPAIAPAFMPTSVLKKLHGTKRMNKPTVKDDAVEEKSNERSEEEETHGATFNAAKSDPKTISNSSQESSDRPIIPQMKQVSQDNNDFKLNPTSRDGVQPHRMMEPAVNASIKFDHVQQHPRLPQQMMPLPYPHVVMPGGPRPIVGRPPLPFGPDVYRQPGMYVPMSHYRVVSPNMIRSPAQNAPPQNFNKNRESNNPTHGDGNHQSLPTRIDGREESQAQSAPNNPLAKWFSKDVLSASNVGNRIPKNREGAISLADIEKDC